MKKVEKCKKVGETTKIFESSLKINKEYVKYVESVPKVEKV
jgi:hypothetical protein